MNRLLYVYVALIGLAVSCQSISKRGHTPKAQDSTGYDNYRITLETINDKSIENRLNLFKVFEKYGKDSEESKKAISELARNDSLYLLEFMSLEKKFGWPLQSEIGEHAVSGAFLVIQHADLKTQQEYLPVVRAAMKKKEINPGFYALLKDRILVSKNKQQKYGTQMNNRQMPNGEVETYVLPVKNYRKLDKWRISVGLDSLTTKLKEKSLIFKNRN